MFTRIYQDGSKTPVVATITLGELTQVDGNHECSCRLVLKGSEIDYDITLIGIEEIQAFENAALLLHTLEEKENLSLDLEE